MRNYSKVSPQFWIGPTGRALREMGPDAQLIALYLMTSPHANLLGLYYLPLPMLAHEIGSSLEEASKGLRKVIEAGFADYDEATETVWVFEMAQHQVSPGMKPNSNQIKGVVNEYARLPKSKFLKDFYEKYREIFHLTECRETGASSKPVRSSSEAASKHLRTQDQDQDQEQDQEQEKEEECAEPPEDRRSTPATGPPSLLDFPVVGRGSKLWPLTQDLVDTMAENYPGVDVLAECRAARGWCQSNPTRRKTARGMPKFLDSWMRRQQERGTARASPGSSDAKPAYATPQRPAEELRRKLGLPEPTLEGCTTGPKESP